MKKLSKKLSEADAGANNIVAEFHKCGLYPPNPERPKARLPQSATHISEEVHTYTSEIVVDILKEIRGVSSTSTEIKRRQKRCDVAPGKSITANDLQKETSHKRKEATHVLESGDSDATIVISPIDDDLDCVSTSSITFNLASVEQLQPKPGPSKVNVEVDKKRRAVKKRRVVRNIKNNNAR